MALYCWIIVFYIHFTNFHDLVTSYNHSFVIDYENNQFLKDGQSFQYISGSIHYYRIPLIYWRDRLLKMFAAGLNAVQIYVPWNFHEPQPGEYLFEDEHNIEGFIKMAQEIGLLVILRPGPYICAEWDMGGLPYWLLSRKHNIKLRTQDSTYLKAVFDWMRILLPKMKPLLYENGGPIITVQVENEYGSYYAHDQIYLEWLRNLFRNLLGSSVVLFTTDGAGDNYLKWGVIPGVYPTIDFGCDVLNLTKAFSYQRKYAPKGPLVNSEFYVGWLTHWNKDNARVPSNCITRSLEIMILNASVNMYMFEGGTNFAYMNGANYPPFSPQITSYDYDAPLTEAGDITEKYMAIQNVIKKHRKIPDIPIPNNIPKFSFGPIYMKAKTTVLDGLSIFITKEPLKSVQPLTFEQIPQDYGFVLYSTNVMDPFRSIASLNITGIRDRGYVFLDEVFQGILIRDQIAQLELHFVKSTQILSILVENQGRINYGPLLNDFKGIISDVYLNTKPIINWITYSLNFNVNLQMLNSLQLQSNKNANTKFIPTVYAGIFNLASFEVGNGDTFLDTTGWGKGQVFINGNNVGRYWPTAGPQITLYVPNSMLQKGDNQIILVELERSNCFSKYCLIKFIDYSILVPDVNNY